MPKMTLATLIVLVVTAGASIIIVAPIAIPGGSLIVPWESFVWIAFIPIASCPHLLLCVAAILARASKPTRLFVLLASLLIGVTGTAVLADGYLDITHHCFVTGYRNGVLIFQTLQAQGFAAVITLIVSHAVAHARPRIET